MSENFLSRWSKRKLEVRAQEKLTEEMPPVKTSMQVADLDGKAGPLSKESPAQPPAKPSTPQPELPLPTEADLLAVKQGGDIKAFMVDKVSTELKNKAFKALFSRPEFNVMDGLDIYIDDYNKFTPLSQEDIGKMTLSKQLLSRPDLEVLKKEDLKEGLDRFENVMADADDSSPVVLDKTDEIEQKTPEQEDSLDSDRVIPDGSQASDLNNEIENRSFETPDKS